MFNIKQDIYFTPSRDEEISWKRRWKKCKSENMRNMVVKTCYIASHGLDVCEFIAAFAFIGHAKD